MSKQNLSYSDFHIDSDFEIRLFVLDLETTYVTHFSEVLAVTQNLSSHDQDLRFIHLVWIPLGLFSRLHRGFPFKVQMNSHKCVLNLKLHWVTSSTYHSCLVPTVSIYRSYKKFSTTVLNYPSTVLHLSAINRRARFIKNSSRKKTLNHEMKIFFF